jgi:hypothetical protein
MGLAISNLATQFQNYPISRLPNFPIPRVVEDPCAVADRVCVGDGAGHVRLGAAGAFFQRKSQRQAGRQR